jgi:hypothetical protein
VYEFQLFDTMKKSISWRYTFESCPVRHWLARMKLKVDRNRKSADGKERRRDGRGRR